MPQIVEEEAKTVRYIYALFIGGMTAHGIAKQLIKEEIPTPGGKKIWQANTVESILTNEKYKGDALLQKRYTVDFLTKKTRVNDGCEIPQYYVQHSHPAIIAPREHEFVQEKIKKRKTLGGRYSGNAFASKIICGDCDAPYGCKVWHSNDKYRREIYQCNRKFKNVQKCTTPNLTEAEIKRAFVAAWNKILAHKSAGYARANNQTIKNGK